MTLKKTLTAVQAALRCIMDGSNAHQRAEARAISSLLDEKFVLHLVIFEDMLETTTFMSDQLQAPNFDLVAAGDLSQSVISAFSEKRTDDRWKDLRQQAEGMRTNIILYILYATK